MTAEPTILLFDVDGTLITTGGVGRRAIVRSLELGGIHKLARFNFGGMTDRAILRRHLVHAGVTVTEARIDELLELYVGVLREEVASAEGEYRLHHGMVNALDAADARVDVALGLGTGNIEVGARIKLERVGVARRFAFGGFGCDSEDRAELIAVGATRGAAQLGRPLDECRVVIIGDTPKDIAAAKANGAASLAVATGGYDLGQLGEHDPTWAFPDLAATGALEALLPH